MTGYQLMTVEQREMWTDLVERQAHAGTMRFTALHATHLREIEALAERLEFEWKKEAA